MNNLSRRRLTLHRGLQNQFLYMRKSMLLLPLFAGQSLLSFGQDRKSDSTLSSLLMLDLGGQGIGVTYEHRLSNKITGDISAGIGGGHDIGEGFFEINYGYPAFYVSLTPKFFYNRQKRIDKGKEMILNSGNYIGLRFKFVAANNGPFDYYRNSVLGNIHWGMRRALGQHWLFNFHVGAGYAEDIDYGFGTIYPAIDFKFSYVFFKPKK